MKPAEKTVFAAILLLGSTGACFALGCHKSSETEAREAALAAQADGAVKEEKLRDLEAVRAWRERLQADLDAIRAAGPGTDWTALKARTHADLDESRPVQVPHSWEKPYGI